MKRGMKQTTDLLQGMAMALDETLNGDERPGKNGFVLLVFPFGGPEGARTNYVSNANRKDIIVALKEIVARFEGQAEAKGKA
jgi:hypothetical protein